jgi:cytochrome P450
VDIEDLVDDFITFYTGGQDSTMGLLSFALVQTLLHPNVLER